jgi:cell wall-associated NlpC family hydrolase
MFDSKVIEDFRLHVLSELPKEACGVVVADRYFACRNIADKPLENFVVHPDDTVAAEQHGSIQAVLHSHVDQRVKSLTEEDMIHQQRMRIPWGVMFVSMGLLSQVVWFGDQVPATPLASREFIFGLYDCWTLVRDHYRTELKITLANAPRSWETWKDDPSKSFLSLERAKREGFQQLSGYRDLQPNDLIFLSVRSPIPNHVALYIDDGLMFHHLVWRQSVLTPVSPWIKTITSCLRYVGVSDV